MRILLATLLTALVVPLAACQPAEDDDGEWWEDPPFGTRWVGYDGVVVAVPDWWTTGETQCGAPVEDTVYFDSGAIYECGVRADPEALREVSSLAVLENDNGAYDGQDLDGECEEWFRGVCRHLFALDGSDTVFAVTIDEEDDGDVEEIGDSLRALPDGVTTVPLTTGGPVGSTPSWGAEPFVVRDLRRMIQRAGLEVEIETVDADPDDAAGTVADLPPGSLLDVSPALGTPIEEGGRVMVTVMGTSGP